ncbi:MAG: hypothetical protein WBC85_11835 [Planktotalea sp.]|uniref:hypothetical protein n=1 Tax=Planktotalea sp. TaxID=2029877 RepID=UPI003C736F46
MEIEDPRFLFVASAVGVACVFLHAPLFVVLLSCGAIGLLAVPPFVLLKAKGFWAAYHPSNFALLMGILKDQSNIPIQKFWVVIGALVLMASCAGLLGLVITETFLPRVSNFEALGRPFAPVAITTLCLYGLFRILIWWAKSKQLAR